MFKVVKKQFLNDAKTICLFEIEAPLVARHAQAGQFVIFRLDEQGERTPVSVAGYDREKGTVTVPDFWNAMSFSVHTNDGKTWEFAPGRNEMGFVYEIQSVTADILAGRTESSVMPHRSTLRVQRTLEFARHTLGFYYPVETEER